VLYIAFERSVLATWRIYYIIEGSCSEIRTEIFFDGYYGRISLYLDRMLFLSRRTPSVINNPSRYAGMKSGEEETRCIYHFRQHDTSWERLFLPAWKFRFALLRGIIYSSDCRVNVDIFFLQIRCILYYLKDRYKSIIQLDGVIPCIKISRKYRINFFRSRLC